VPGEDGIPRRRVLEGHQHHIVAGYPFNEKDAALAYTNIFEGLDCFGHFVHSAAL
jgi:hypothetical protein